MMAGIRERLGRAEVPDLVQGTTLGLILAGLLSLAFMGFGGMSG
jgi:electron transport complex protein RnfA